MRNKKKATEVKVKEDLAPGIKKVFDDLNMNRQLLNLESVWTIDGRIEFKHLKNPMPFEIRSFSEFEYLMSEMIRNANTSGPNYARD